MKTVLTIVKHPAYIISKILTILRFYRWLLSRCNRRTMGYCYKSAIYQPLYTKGN